MGNQQQTGRTRSDTYARYERDGEDGRYVTLEPNDSSGNSYIASFDERVILLKINNKTYHCHFFYNIQTSPRHDSSLPIRIRNQREIQQAVNAELQNEKKTIPVVFRYPASPKDKEALLTGTFTNWKEMILMVKR
jgi:hypothetical protein